MSELFSQDEVRKALSTMLEPRAVFEVRSVDAQLRGNRRTGTVSGYFDNGDACLSELEKLAKAKGIYFTVNPVNAALLARRKNRLDYAEKDGTTKDDHILRRRHLIIDVDYDRPSGISTTDAEKEITRNKAREIYAYLKKRGLPLPLVADSGNGYHLDYRIELSCEDDGLVEKALDGLANCFDGDGVELDRGVHNPSRIIKLYGTLACKGDNTEERPWRLSKILQAPDTLQVVTSEQLRALADELLPKEPEKGNASVSSRPERNNKPSKAQVREMLAVIPKRPHYHDWIPVVAAVGDALPLSDAVEVLEEWSPGEEPGEYAKKLQSAFEKIHVGTLFHIAKQHGWTPSDNKEKSVPRKSAATELVELAEKFTFFHDDQDRPFVRLERDGHPEIWPVESTKFRKLLARVYYKKMKKAVNRNALADAITTLAGKACHDGGEEPVFLRVAPHDGNILIDLCNKQWCVVEVTPEGWRILERSPVAFIRTGSMQALPLPVQGGGSIEPLWQLLNVTEAQRPLVIGSLLNAFDPEGPYFVTNYVGEHGTAKSSAAKIERQLVDPSSNPLRSPPKEERDLISQAASNWIVALDNLSYLPAWLSDATCRLSTGGGHSARTLYTDLEEISLAVKRPVFLNGIEDVAVRPDLADRALQIELEEIPKENRMLEKVLWSELDRHRTEIFSAILDGLSCALRNRPKVKIKYLPRMADAVIWVTAGETAFGFKRGTFLKAYAKNLDESAAAAIELNPVGLAITQLLEKQGEWSGTPAELLEALGALVGDEQKRKTKEWPQNARALGQTLRRLAPALRRAGFDYQRPPREAGRRIIVLSKRCKDPKTSSQTSQTSFAQEEPESATSSHFGTESTTSSWVPQGNDDHDDHDDVFPTPHDGDKKAPEPSAGAPIEPDAVDL